MYTRANLLALLMSFMLLAGCSSVEKTDPNQVPSPTISSAKFDTDGKTVIITGEFFKVQSDDKKDVVTTLDGHVWTPATSIGDSSATQYTAVLPWGVSYPQVWVRVFGLNGEYSQPVLVGGVIR